ESFGQGDWFIQDWTPQAMLEMLPFTNVFRAWDVCAAPGGKTAGLAWKLGEKGEVWATDFSPVRMVKLKENLRRLGLAKVRVFEETIDKIPPHLGGRPLQRHGGLIPQGGFTLEIKKGRN